ncbi:PRC-barrel domain-containing protein [Hyphobacterium marinum]|uniref:PRC-barrel domain-containing protein n=1 Tax=Hyphobacterium marinum TaxID=3116574 RepID=A0ABU7LWG3_9PROT|nr:PRC-barrel domain-containing protein [Hyphobacterium sp. Y6023]MEE2565888.1 PRC-barrel domain-containing protein [Hyphobacterium sp. Y6023]
MSILPRTFTATSLHGIDIVSPSGRKLGVLEDVAVGAASGKVLYVLIALDRPSEIGERLYAVPWETLSFDPATDRCVLNVPVETLREAPALPSPEAFAEPDPRLRYALSTHFGRYPDAA